MRADKAARYHGYEFEREWRGASVLIDFNKRRAEREKFLSESHAAQQAARSALRTGERIRGNANAVKVGRANGAVAIGEQKIAVQHGYAVGRTNVHVGKV